MKYDTIVLAGGAARRLGGADKPSLSVGGRALLDRVLDACPDAGTTVVVGSRRATARPVRWTREEPAGGGPLAALAAGLRHTTADLVLVLSADLPFLDHETVRTLLAAATTPATAGRADPAGPSDQAGSTQAGAGPAGNGTPARAAGAPAGDRTLPWAAGGTRASAEAAGSGTAEARAAGADAAGPDAAEAGATDWAADDRAGAGPAGDRTLPRAAGGTRASADAAEVGAAWAGGGRVGAGSAGSGGGGDGALLRDGGGRDQPLVAVYRAESLRRELALLATEHGYLIGLPLRALTAELDLTRVPAPPLASFDCDTWGDLAAARARIREHGNVLDQWITAVKTELGLDLTVDTKTLLDLARDAAHGVARPAAPLTTFLVGYAAARAEATGADPAQAVADASRKAAELALRWAAEAEDTAGPRENGSG